MPPKIDSTLLIEIEELMVIGMSYEALIATVQIRYEERAQQANQEAKDRGAECDPGKTEVSERTIQRYMKRVKDRWATEEEQERPERRKELRRKLNAVFSKSYMEGGQSLSAAVQCLRIQAKIDGLEAPQKVEINADINVKLMSPFQRQARIEELWALRRGTLGREDAPLVIDVPPAPKKLPAKRKAKPKKKAPAKKAKPKPKAKTARKRTK